VIGKRGKKKLMEFRLTIHAVGMVGLGLAATLTAPLNVFGQAPGYGPPATSYAAEAARYPDAASKPTPHLADGHPDLNGVWHHYFGGLVSQVGANSFTLDFGRSVPHGTSAGGPPPPRATPDPDPEYKKGYLAKVKYLNDNQVKEDRTLHCMPPGVPRIGPPQQIVATPKQAVFLYADLTGNHWRVIPLDGRAHSSDPDDEGTYDGDSVGHWDGDTLVVDVTRLASDSWLADNGFFHSEQLHVVERLRRVGDTIQYQMTANDPKVLEKPWTLSRTLTLQPDALEEAAPCVDNDAGHYVNQEHHDNAR
jgi:hypothetical protein